MFWLTYIVTFCHVASKVKVHWESMSTVTSEGKGWLLASMYPANETEWPSVHAILASGHFTLYYSYLIGYVYQMTLLNNSDSYLLYFCASHRGPHSLPAPCTTKSYFLFFQVTPKYFINYFYISSKFIMWQFYKKHL